MVAKHQEGRRTGIQRHQPSRKGTGSKEDGQELGRRPQRKPTTNQNQPTQRRSHERHHLAHRCTRWLEMVLCGKRLCKQQTQATSTTTTPSPRLRQPNQRHTNTQRRRLKPTTKTKAALTTTTLYSCSPRKSTAEPPQQ